MIKLAESNRSDSSSYCRRCRHDPNLYSVRPLLSHSPDDDDTAIPGGTDSLSFSTGISKSSWRHQQVRRFLPFPNYTVILCRQSNVILRRCWLVVGWPCQTVCGGLGDESFTTSAIFFGVSYTLSCYDHSLLSVSLFSFPFSDGTEKRRRELFIIFFNDRIRR